MGLNDLLRRELSRFLSTEAIDALEADIQGVNPTELTDAVMAVSSREENIDGLSSVITLVNASKVKYAAHIASGGAGLASAIALANDCKAKYNAHLAAAGTALDQAMALANALKVTYTAHIADAAEHAAADAVNVISSADATDVASLYTLVGDLLTQYDAHEGDSEGGGALAYHHAVEAGDVSVSGTATPTSLAASITALNELRTKYNAHDADGIPHTTGSQNQETNAAASAIGSEIHPHTADVTNTTAAATATNLASLITLITELLTDYDAHEGDGELAADWAYHKAKEGGNCSLASTAAPTSLAECITRINDFKAKYNIHVADTTMHGAAGTAVATANAAVGAGEHPAQADTANAISAASATSTLAQAIALMTELLTDYDAHEGDAELASAWVYHEAQEAGDHSLASKVAPTTLQECITRANDFKAKFNAHDADGTCHTTGSTQQVSASDAAYGVVIRKAVTGVKTTNTITAEIKIAGTGSVATVTAACNVDGYIDFTFDADPQNDCVYSYVIS